MLTIRLRRGRTNCGQGIGTRLCSLCEAENALLRRLYRPDAGGADLRVFFIRLKEVDLQFVAGFQLRNVVNMFGNGDVQRFAVARAQTNHTFGCLDRNNFKNACGCGRVVFDSRKRRRADGDAAVLRAGRLFARQPPC